MKHDVVALATCEGRKVGTTGHDDARDHIKGRLEQIGIQPYRGRSFLLPYSDGVTNFVNIVGRIQGQDDNLPPNLLGAHYDSYESYPGADDNAAAVATLLAASEKLKDVEQDRTIIIAFFDAEEPPSFLDPLRMGSIRFYEDQRLEEIHCAIIMDLVGHDVPVPGLEDILFVTGMESDPGLEAVVKGAEPSSGIRTVPTLNRYVGDMSDYYWFSKKQRPYLLLTCGRWEHYHKITDTPDRLNYQKMTAVMHYLIDLSTRLDGGTSSTQLVGPFDGPEPTGTELYFLRKHIQPAMSSLGLDMELNSRANIDLLIGIMTRQFGL